MMCSQTFLFQAVMRCSANHWHYSKADCIMIGTIKVFFTRWSIWECKGRGEAGVEALHPSATCRSARMIHGSHFVSKSHHKSVCHEKEADTHSVYRQSMREFADVCQRYGKDQGKLSSKAASQNTYWMLFICSTHQLLFPCSSLIIQG